jgi:hypothetical protein
MATPQADIAIQRLLSWVPDLPTGDNMRLFIESLIDEIGELVVIVEQIYAAFDLDTAVGDQLDKLGAILRLPRSGFNDADYRRNIKVRIEIIKSKFQYLNDIGGIQTAANSVGDPGSINKIITIVREFIGAVVGDIEYVLVPPYSFKLTIPGSLSVIEITQIFNFIRESIYAGVLGYIIFVLGTQGVFWAQVVLPNPNYVVSVNEAETVFSVITTEFNDTPAVNFQPFVSEYAVDAYCAFGFPTLWQNIYFDHTGGVDGDNSLSIRWEYWDGATWSALGGVSDGTDSMRSSADDQLLTFNIPTDWATTSIDGSPSLYFIRAYIDNVSGGGDEPTYVGGHLGGSQIAPIGQWDPGAVPGEGQWAAALGPATKVWSADGIGGFVDETSNFNTMGPAFQPFSAGNLVDAYVAFGFDYPLSPQFILGAPVVQGTNGVVVWEYWDGATWTALPGILDGTVSFTSAANPQIVDWTDVGATQTPVSLNGESAKYYIRARITQVYIVVPQYDQGSLKWPNPEGIWDQNAGIGIDEGTWAGVLSTAGPNTSLANTNT